RAEELVRQCLGSSGPHAVEIRAEHLRFPVRRRSTRCRREPQPAQRLTEELARRRLSRKSERQDAALAQRASCIVDGDWNEAVGNERLDGHRCELVVRSLFYQQQRVDGLAEKWCVEAEIERPALSGCGRRSSGSGR